MFQIYTDGGCRHNPGLGAWSYVVVKDNKIIFQSNGSKASTTNNEMELTAILHAVRYAIIHHLFSITIFTDSQYSLNAITQWYPQWKANGTLAGKKNIDLIQKIINLATNRNITFQWVKAHANNPYNNLADHLVNQAMDALK